MDASDSPQRPAPATAGEGHASPNGEARVEPSPRPRSSSDQVAFLSRLAAGLAHEIKNPLSTMAINLGLLEEEWTRPIASRGGEPAPREQRSLKRVKTLQREVARLEAILDDFLRFARGGEINRSPQDLGLLLRELLDFVEPQDTRQGIRHHVELPVGLPLCMLDPTAFKQAILNLLVNARQAMPSGGELVVRLQRSGNWAEVTVTDTGHGMLPHALERCWDEYWSDKKNGSGLGLPTARRIIEEHGGTISVLSEHGRGTSFTIHLPLMVELTSPVPPEKKGARA